MQRRIDVAEDADGKNKRDKKGRSMDDDDDDAILDHVIAKARKLLDEQLAELEELWNEVDPMYARCPEDGGVIAPCVGQSPWRYFDGGGDVVQQASLCSADCPFTACANLSLERREEGSHVRDVRFSADFLFAQACCLFLCKHAGLYAVCDRWTVPTAQVIPKTLTVFFNTTSRTPR